MTYSNRSILVYSRSPVGIWQRNARWPPTSRTVTSKLRHYPFKYLADLNRTSPIAGVVYLRRFFASTRAPLACYAMSLYTSAAKTELVTGLAGRSSLRDILVRPY